MKVEYSPLRLDDGRVIAYCTCGWKAPWLSETPDAAALTWDEHVRTEHR